VADKHVVYCQYLVRTAITPPEVREPSTVMSVCLRVRLFVCPRAYLQNCMSNLYHILCMLCNMPGLTLSSDLAALTISDDLKHLNRGFIQLIVKRKIVLYRKTVVTAVLSHSGHAS